MGLYSYTYVGCYIQYKHKQLEVGDQLITYETEKGEVFKEEINFSPITGDPVHKKVLNVTKTETIGCFYDINENLSKDYADYFFPIPEGIAPKDASILISNSKEKFCFEIDQNEIKDIDFYAETAIESFILKYKDFINELKKHVDDVTVKLGVINYQH